MNTFQNDLSKKTKNKSINFKLCLVGMVIIIIIALHFISMTINLNECFRDFLFWRTHRNHVQKIHFFIIKYRK